MNRLEAIETSIKIWGELAETGGNSKGEVARQYGEFNHHCPLCEEVGEGAGYWEEGGCDKCPYFQEYGMCQEHPNPYDAWRLTESNEDRKKHARDFLAQLLYLQHKEGDKKKSRPKFKVGDKVCCDGEETTVLSVRQRVAGEGLLRTSAT